MNMPCENSMLLYYSNIKRISKKIFGNDVNIVEMDTRNYSNSNPYIEIEYNNKISINFDEMSPIYDEFTLALPNAPVYLFIDISNKILRIESEYYGFNEYIFDY